MKKTFLRFLCIIIMTCNMACERKKGVLENCDVVTSNNVISLKIEDNLYVEKYSNLFSDVKYIPLEETRNSIVGTVSKLEITNDNELIIFDARAGAVFRFAPDGKFLNNIGFRGAGEKEYILPEDVKYDPFSNKVLVWDGGKRVILTYALNGELEKKIQLPWVIGTFGIIDEDYLICYMNNGEDIRGNEKGTNFKLIKRDGTIVKEFGEYGAEKAKFRPPTEHVFCLQFGKCLTLLPYSYTLFSIDRNSMNAIATFDLLENAIPQEWLCGQFVDFWKKKKRYSNLIEIASVYETAQYYFLNLIQNGHIILCMLQKEKDRIKSIPSFIINDMYGMIGENNLSTVSNEKLYYTIDPLEFKNEASFLQKFPNNFDIKKGILKDKDDIYSYLCQIYGEKYAKAYIDSLTTTDFKLAAGEREFIEEMAKRSNPIIQICTLK